MATDNGKITLTTGVGTISFPHVFKETASINDKGEAVYDLQFIIPKSQKKDVQALLRAIKEVGEEKWGDNWKKGRVPLRDGDKEADDPTGSGETKGEKYPERLGCYFFSARSSRPVGVYNRRREPINNPDELYGGCKGKINITLYPYSNQGNWGVGVGLNGVQKVADGDSLGGGGRPSVESMFDELEDEEDDFDLDDDFDEIEEDVEETKPAPKKKAPAKKKAAPKGRKKPAAKKVEEEVEEDDEDEDDLYDDLDQDDDF